MRRFSIHGHFVGLFLGLLFLPGVLLATEPLSIRAPDAGTVTRGEFIRAAVQTFEIPLPEEVDLPYERVPKGLAPYIAAAYERGALAIFGDDLGTGKSITRGESLQVVVKLLNVRPEKVTVKFSDVSVKTDEENAVQVAVDRRWMKPVRKNLFGVSRPLTGKEARLLLRRVVQGVPAKDDSPVPKVRINIRVPKEELPKSDILNTIWQLLTEQYLYREKLKPDEAAYRAAEALVESLGDPYTVFMRPVKNEQFQTQIQGEITGIGAQVELRSGVLVIVSPLKGSPAEKAGLLPGDEIHAVDGESLKGLGLEDAVGKVRGPKGTTVKLRIHRNGAEFDVTVIRDVVRVPEIEISFQGSIAIVKLHQFGQITERDLRSLMEKVQEQKPTGLVLDLRNNPGGLLHAAEVVLSNFVPQGSPVAVILSPEQEYTELTDDPPTIGASIPVVVLVNKGSASASEIVAGALQDAKRARVIGEQTFGKGSVQQVLQFNDGSSLKMTIAEYLTPSRHKVDGIGITPDRVIPMEAGGRDTQLLEALDLLR